jgi:nickel/cobalt transporter (NicO) family protein
VSRAFAARRRRRLALAVLALSAMLGLPAALGPQTASAHPLGNFSVNHLSQVRISEGRVELHYILDQAEIPTFQESQRFDSDGNGKVEGEERGPLLRSKLAEIAPDLSLTADGRPLGLGAPHDAMLSFPPGQGGLPLTRVEADFDAPLPRGATRVEAHDETYQGRVGWKAIRVLAGEGTDVRSSVPATDPTNGLRAYPVDLLSSPPDVRSASFAVSTGSGQVTAPKGPDGGEVTTNRGLDGFAGTLTSSNDHGWLILLLFAAAFGWGALHALSPGHGKSMVAGYLVGSRGTPRHAAILGLTVTITHTFAVFALGLVTLFASQYVLPEDIYPWLGVVSGLMVVAIGLAVMRSRFRRWRAMRARVAHEQGHQHRHGHAHDDGHSHRPGHEHRHSHEPEQDHAHSHAPPAGQPLSMRTLLALGVSGGAIPCPSALVVLIAAISQHRVGLGMALIFAFSLGLAATLTAVGLAVLYGGRLMERLRPERRLFGARFAGALPALSATIIVVAGTLITLRAIPQVG